MKIFTAIEMVVSLLEIGRLVKIARGLALYPLIAIWKKQDDLWLFGCLGNQYMENSRHFYEYIVKNRRNVRPYWVTENRELCRRLKERGLPACMMGSPEWLGFVLQAKVSVFSYNKIADIGVPTTKSTFDVQMNHGVPIKAESRHIKHGKGIIGDFLANAGKTFPGIYRAILQDIDLSIVNSRMSVKPLSAEWGIPESRIRIVGYPRNDALRPKRKRKGKKLKILYAPTYRYGRTFLSQLKQAGFDAEKTDSRLLELGAVMALRPHKPSGAVAEQQASATEIEHAISGTKNIVLDYSMDLHDALGDYDILITDYSSIYYDFLLTGKPIIFLAYDFEEFEKRNGFYYDYRKFAPGPVARNWKDVLELIAWFPNHPDPYRGKRKALNRIMNVHRDGKSSVRAYNEIMKLIGKRPAQN